MLGTPKPLGAPWAPTELVWEREGEDYNKAMSRGQGNKGWRKRGRHEGPQEGERARPGWESREKGAREGMAGGVPRARKGPRREGAREGRADGIPGVSMIQFVAGFSKAQVPKSTMDVDRLATRHPLVLAVTDW